MLPRSAQGFIAALLVTSSQFACGAAPPPDRPHGTDLLFSESFDSGLGERWVVPLGNGYQVVEGGERHGRVPALKTIDLPTYLLIRGSENWGAVRVEGDVLFPDSVDNYLGFIWGFRDDGRRMDFGSMYIKGNGSYLQANSHYDTNVGRTLYPEIRANLLGERAIHTGEWQRFALEVVGGAAHLYVGDMVEPAMAMPFGAPGMGAIGFTPRNPGGAVWVDNVTAVSIEGFTHDGSGLLPAYRSEARITDWEVLGPLEAYRPDIESGSESAEWRPFEVDARGAVVTGSVTEYRGGRRVAYFRTVIPSDRQKLARLEFSTVDHLALWLNGRFVGYGPRQSRAWFDAGENEEHSTMNALVELEPGENELLVRVVGGVYASGGFFLRMVDRE